MKNFTFYMEDAYGDDFYLTVSANSEKEARSIANMACDDAFPGKLIKNFKINANSNCNNKRRN